MTLHCKVVKRSGKCVFPLDKMGRNPVVSSGLAPARGLDGSLTSHPLRPGFSGRPERKLFSARVAL